MIVAPQRVLDAEGTMEISISANGSAKGVQINGPITFVSRPSSQGVLHGKGQGVLHGKGQGVLHGKGQGVLLSGESEMATYTAEGIGKITPSGVNWRGAVFLRAGSNGRLAFLNNVVGIFEAEVDTEGNFSEKSWEWK